MQQGDDACDCEPQSDPAASFGAIPPWVICSEREEYQRCRPEGNARRFEHGGDADEHADSDETFDGPAGLRLAK